MPRPAPLGDDPLFEDEPAPVFDAGDRQIGARWLFGLAGTWIALSFLADNKTTNELASALAVTIAVSATFVLWEPVAKEIARVT